MDAPCSLLRPLATISTTAFLLLLLLPWQLALLPPSTNWMLSDYYYYNVSDVSYKSQFQKFRYRNFTVCINESSSFELLNEQEKGLYGRPTGIVSAHYFLPYTVYFSLYFVTPAENICVKDINGSSVASYHLSLVALNAYGRTQDPNKGNVVWTANPMNPVTENACLRLDDSNLTLLDHHGNNRSSPQVIWQISTGASNLSLAISFEGNIVLFSNTTDPPYVPLWESFGYPTDTLMVLQVLEKQPPITVHSTAASNSRNYTLAIENGRMVLYARIGQQLGDEESPYGSPYWVWPSSSLPADDNNISFAAFCWDSVHQLRLIAGSDRSSDNFTQYRGVVSPEFCSTIPDNSGTSIQISGLDPSMNSTFATFLRLDADGDLRAYTVDNTTYPDSNAVWRAFYNIFNSTPCDLPLYCGVYGMCDLRRGNDSYCRCNYSDDAKLVFADDSDPKLGCMLEKDNVKQLLWDLQNISIFGQASTCPAVDNMEACEGSVCEIIFLSVNNVSYFSLSFTKSYQVANDSPSCRAECKNHSCCTAAFWNESTGSCFLVLGRLGTIQQHGTMVAFIKYVKITPAPSSSNYLWKVAGSVLGVAFVVACIFLGYRQTRRGAQAMNELRMERMLRSELQKERVLLLSLLDVDCGNTEKFTWKQMLKYTDGFSCFLGGGGFGRVFRGALPDGTVIAVKQLDEDRSQGQGNKEFIAEVSILSRIHHAHLVRLIGFCLEGMHRLLVYEYMENGSLDAWLFQNPVPSMLLEAHTQFQTRNVNEKKVEGRELLPWKTRFQIAVGTAKGLAYLHEECEERVIHMDLKPQNILLGRNFQAKISDFGMSKRTGREQSSVMTVMRGTPGYLAPEWLLDCAITEKCDVYSFGIVLLEMVSGRKVKDLKAVKQKLSMRPLRESVMLDLLDESFMHSNDVNEREAVRMVEVALLCVKKDPRKRPAMSRVAWMLEGREKVQHDDDDDDAQGLMKQEEVQRFTRFKEEVQRFTRFMESASSSTNNTIYIWDSNNDDNENNLSQKNSKKKMHKKYIELEKPKELEEEDAQKIH